MVLDATALERCLTIAGLTCVGHLGCWGPSSNKVEHQSGLSDVFGQIFDAPMRIEKPFFWSTKTDVVSMIARLDMADQIAHTRSCADVHNEPLRKTRSSSERGRDMLKAKHLTVAI